MSARKRPQKRYIHSQWKLLRQVKFETSKQEVLISWFLNIHRYYICYGGEPIGFQCPEGLHFNPEINTCDFIENVNCTVSIFSQKPSWPTISSRFFLLKDWRSSKTRRSTTTSRNRLWMCWFHFLRTSSEQLRTLLHLLGWRIHSFRLCSWTMVLYREQLVWYSGKRSMWR